MVTRAAFLLYAGTMLVGVIAQMRWYRFGWVHHVLYFLCFAGALAAAWTDFHPALLLTLAALAALPLARPRTPWHPALALLGLLGYVGAFAQWPVR